MRQFVLYQGLLFALIVSIALPAFAQQKPNVVRVDFEDHPARTPIKTEYGGVGITFPRGAFLDADSAARSGTRVLRAADPAIEFHPGPLIIEFSTPQQRVAFFAGTTLFTNAVNGTLRAFDAKGNQVAQDGPKSVAPRTFVTPFQVRTSTPVIVHVEFEIPPAEFEAIDDLEVEGQPPQPPPTDTPVVQISSPANGRQVDLEGSLAIEGTVTGAAVLPTATLKVDYRKPPESTAPPFVTALALAGSGPTRNFSAVVDLRFLGPLAITVEAVNTGGRTGSGSVEITNLPTPIRERYTASGGATALGEFFFGADDGKCRAAVYQRGLVSLQADTTRLVTGPIFTKWLAMRDAINGSLLGCPLTEERSSLSGAKAQDFRNGRIYSGLPNGTIFVPRVFSNAIDRLGGEAATGLPIADPKNSLASNTWLFQQFIRPGQAGLPSTLEIRGSPPTLLVERPGGDLATLNETGLRLSDSTATLWQQFSCSSNNGPCSAVSPPINRPPVNLLADPGGFCEGLVYPLTVEWKAILGTDYAYTSVAGFVQRAFISDADNPIVHEYSNDWDMFVRPFQDYTNLLPQGVTFLEMEHESYFSNYFFAQYDQVRPGDLIFAVGRWIVDCGHNDYHTEIHPSFVIAYMRTEQYTGKPATAAYIWVNGFYPGDPVDVEIYPPPRPSPDASLVIIKPLDNLAARDVQVQTPSLPVDHAVVRFSSSPRRVEVTDSGEMMWQTGRGYGGKWYVFWSSQP